MAEEGIAFKQCANAFMACAKPKRLQQLADSLTPWDLLSCGQKWLARLTPFFTAREREQAGCQHRLFFSQVEFCDNLIFRRRAALDKLGERLLDANRTIGQPNKITVIFGRRISRHYRGKLQTEIEDMDLPNPVIRSHYGNGFVKQYVRDHLILRTEAASNNVNSMSSTMPLGGRRPWTISIHWPERSASANRFFSAVSHCVSNRPIWLGEAAELIFRRGTPPNAE